MKVVGTNKYGLPPGAQQIIAKCKAVHGERYIYDKVNYINQKHKITVTCRVHGDFDVLAPNHYLKKSGCPECAKILRGRKKRQKAASVFIEKCRAVHGDRYDYSKTKYTGLRDLVTITCREHGDFKIRTDVHLHAGGNCQKCAGQHRYSKDELLAMAKLHHGDKYDYSLWDDSLTKNVDKITIICPKHGKFTQLIVDHAKDGHGCSKCAGIVQLTRSERIKQGRKFHGDKYDYSLLPDRFTCWDKVKIICPIHGVFEQLAHSHFKGGKGCNKCKPRKISDSQTLKIDEIIDRAKKKHGDKYDYSKTVYCNDTFGKKEKIIIVNCPKHGDFKISSRSHLQGSGCSLCANCGYQPNKPGFVYVLRSADHNQDIIKVGISNVPKQRHAQLAKATPFAFDVIECCPVAGPKAPEIEKAFHSLGENAGLTGFDGATEWFKYDANLLEILRDTCLSNRTDIQ